MLVIAAMRRLCSQAATFLDEVEFVGVLAIENIDPTTR
jgi:hypothetical protein